ncbi:MAG: glycosyltransferase family 2 protein, partial [Patescibacteria group bacterium]
MKISVVVNTRNEAEELKKLLETVSWADEIVVIDMESTDDSREVAKAKGAKIYKHKFLNFVEPARNFGIKKAAGDWILILDPDERVPGSLAKKLTSLAENDDGITYVRIPRKNMIFGKWIKNSRFWPDYNIRFFKKGCVEWDDKIHSIPITEGRGIDLEEEKDFAIIHNHYTSVSQYILRMNRYTDVQASELFEKKEETLWTDFIKKPLAEFLSRFFAGKGYQDGIHGLVLSFLQAFSEFMVVIKLWEKQGFNKKPFSLTELESLFSEMKRELNYWLRSGLI